jgi:hypothetical protein
VVKVYDRWKHRSAVPMGLRPAGMSLAKTITG